MKKDSLKSTIKTAKKTAKKDIELNLINELRKATGELGQSGKKLDKKIAKGSKRLAKMLAHQFKFDKKALTNSTDAETVKEPEAQVDSAPAAKPVNPKTVKAATAIKPVKKVN